MFQFIPGAVVLLSSDQLACSAQTKVREARFICFKLSLAVFGRCLFACVHSAILLDEMELHVCLGSGSGWFPPLYVGGQW